MRISFVVPTRNSERTLDACLGSLRAQTHPDVEVIVVDNSSADATAQIAHRHAHQFIQWGPERSAQRNKGTACSTGDVVVFVDSDMVLEPHVAAEIRDRFEQESDIGALIIPERSFGDGFLSRCRELEKRLYAGDAAVESPRAFRRPLIESLGGWDESLTAAEDWDLADRTRIVTAIGRVHAWIWHDEGHIRLSATFAKKRYYGRWIDHYVRMHGSTWRRRFVRTALLSQPTELLRHPMLTAGLATLKLTEAAGLMVGVRDNHLARTRPAGGVVTAAPRVVHLIAEFSAHEAMGRTVAETAARVPGEHHLVTARVHDGTAPFAGVHELGGRVATFPFGRTGQLAALLHRIRPDLVHLHVGALGTLAVLLPVLRRRRTLLTVYAWPTVPGPGAWRRASLAQMRASNVLRPRVALSTVLPPALTAPALRRAGVTTVLTPDPRVANRLGGRGGVRVTRLPSGAPSDERRAHFDADRPVIVFAGRAESVRGLDTLLAAFPLVRRAVPGARLRLLLIPRPELPAILARAGAADGADAVQVVTEPVPDLLAELAAAQVGTWPFKFDYTTSPPAMAVAEAMSVGLPTVATDVACVRAVLEPDVNGLIVPPARPVALAEALVRLLRDETTWQRYADAGVRSVRERLGWDRAAAVTAAAYAENL